MQLTTDRKKALLCTNGIVEFGGAPIVVVEVAEYLASRGFETVIAANYVGDPFKAEVERTGISITDDPGTLNAFDFDIVWLQNHIAPLLRYELTTGSKKRTTFVFAHLSPTGKLAFPGPILQPLLADWTLANSEETKSNLVQVGVPESDICLFPNPAPAAFWTYRKPPSDLRVVRAISNHAPVEVTEALKILGSMGLAVELVGKAGQSYQRVSPELIAETSALITIGKSVQYAIASGVPTYVYDRFGGPGYLSQDNFDIAAATNFSGRCCKRRANAAMIASEIVDGFSRASRYVMAIPAGTLSKYRLEPHIDQIINTTAKPNAERLASLTAQMQLLRREHAMAQLIRGNFRSVKLRDAQVAKLRRDIQALQARRNGGAHAT